MATDSLDMTSNDWRIVRENLVQLHCENVSWEQASDKIPLDLVRYLLGDLVQHLSTLVFLRGNRCLFTINWTHIPDSISVWENLLSDFFDKRIQTQVGHYRFTYMLSYVGPKYDDLVNVYCHAHWGSPHPSFRREDVREAGTLHPMEHPEMLYLPPSLPGSTPKKPEMVRNPTEGNLPNLEEMGHHLVFLRGNRCLFTINWTHIPDSISVWENLLSDFFDKRIQTQVGHYRFTYMLSYVGPKYDDLVNVYCHAHWGSPHPSFRREDVREAGTLHPMEHPEMLYLPPKFARIYS